MSIQVTELLALPVSERVDIMLKVWESLQDNNKFALSQEQEQELDRRIDNFERGSTKGKSWADVKNS